MRAQLSFSNKRDDIGKIEQRLLEASENGDLQTVNRIILSLTPQQIEAINDDVFGQVFYNVGTYIFPEEANETVEIMLQTVGEHIPADYVGQVLDHFASDNPVNIAGISVIVNNLSAIHTDPLDGISQSTVDAALWALVNYPFPEDSNPVIEDLMQALNGIVSSTMAGAALQTMAEDNNWEGVSVMLNNLSDLHTSLEDGVSSSVIATLLHEMATYYFPEDVIDVMTDLLTVFHESFGTINEYTLEQFSNDYPDLVEMLEDNGVYVGSDGNDNIDGTDADDVLYGLGGDDILFGGRGADIIHGGEGNDWIRDGEQFVNDGETDLLYGGAGDDLIQSFWGHDIIEGGDGNDQIIVGEHATVDAGAGDDTVSGGFRDDVINGGDGNDVIEGNAGADVMTGGAGNDTFAYTNATAPWDHGSGDIITDFTLFEDVLDLEFLMSNYDPEQDAITDFLTATEVDGNTVFSIDFDGEGGEYDSVEFLTLEGVQNITNENLQDLVDEGVIVF